MIDRIVDDCKLLADESFLLAQAGRMFLINELLPELDKRSPSAKLLLPNRSFKILSRLAQGGREQARADAAEALEVVGAFERRGRLERPGEAAEVRGKDASTRDLLVRLVYQHQLKHELAFLTVDESTAHALLGTNRAAAIQRARPVRVFGVAPSGVLRAWDPPVIDAEPALGWGGPVVRAFDLERIATESKLFIDTCSFMSPLAEAFVQRLAPALSPERRLFVAERVLRELERHARSERSPKLGPAEVEERAERARQGLRLVEGLKRDGLIDARGDAHEVAGSEIFFDALMLRLIAQHQKQGPITLVTQDRALATQVLLNAENLGASSTRVGFINDAKPRRDLPLGHLGNWQWRLSWNKSSAAPAVPGTTSRAPRRRSENPTGRDGAQRDAAASKRRDAVPAVMPFQRVSSVARVSGKRLAVSVMPGEGDSVYADKRGALALGKRLSEGGEGMIFETSVPEVVCKVYFEHLITADRFAKLELMVSRSAPSATICWPEELVKNRAGELVGYLMRRARGEIFNLTIFKKPLLEQTFPAWGRLELVELAITTLSLIERLHRINVILGDINPNNFMVVSEREVYLVDTDSFQVEGFACPVGTPHFTPPELIGQSYAEVLRTPEHEAFAVATLLFMILMPGKPPYAGQGGGDVVESIREQRFPYVTEQGERSSKPFGPYRLIWSHLYKRLKTDFIEIFAEGHRQPVRRDADHRFTPAATYVEQFLRHLGEYRDSIRRGWHGNELFPTEIWLSSREEVVELACAEVGCPRRLRTLKKWHAEMLERGQTIVRCDTHREVHQLRRELDQFTRESARSESTSVAAPSFKSRRSLVAAQCAHCGRSDNVPAERLNALAAQGKSYVHPSCRDSYFEAKRLARGSRRRYAGGPTPSAGDAGRVVMWVLIVFFVIFFLFALGRR